MKQNPCISTHLFQADQVIGNAPNGRADFIDLMLAPSLSPTLGILQAWDPLYTRVLVKCKEAHAEAEAIARSLHPTPLTLPASSAAQDEILRLLSLTVTHNTSQGKPSLSQTEQGKAAGAEMAKIKYKLLFAAVSTTIDMDNGSTTQSIVYPTLRTAFLDTVEASTKHDTTRLFHENFTAHLRWAQSADTGHWLTSYANIRFATYDSYLATSLTNALWASTHPATAPADYKKLLSVFAFLSPDLQLQAFQRRDAAGVMESAECLAQEHAAKRQRMSTEIFTGGSQRDIQDVLIMLANLHGLADFIVEPTPATKPIFVQILEAFATLLKTPDARTWFSYHSTYPHLAHSLILSISTTLRPLFQLMTEQDYRRAVVTNAPINPKVFTTPLAVAHQHVSDITGMILSMSITSFQFTPPTFGTLGQIPPPTWGSVPPGTPGNAALGNKNKTPEPVNPKPWATPKTPDGQADKATHGIITFIRDGNPPPHCKTVWVKQPTGQLVRLCSNHLITGLHCKRGATCPFAHVTKLGDLTSDNRKLFLQWVKDTPSLSLTTNSPAGTPNPVNTPGNAPTTPAVTP